MKILCEILLLAFIVSSCELLQDTDSKSIVEFTNSESGCTIDELFIKEADSESWGDNLVAGSGIRYGSSNAREFEVEGGKKYSIKASSNTNTKNLIQGAKATFNIEIGETKYVSFEYGGGGSLFYEDLVVY